MFGLCGGVEVFYFGTNTVLKKIKTWQIFMIHLVWDDRYKTSTEKNALRLGLGSISVNASH